MLSMAQPITELGLGIDMSNIAIITTGIINPLGKEIVTTGHLVRTNILEAVPINSALSPVTV